MKRKTVLKRISCYFLTLVLVFSLVSWLSCEESAAASTVTRYKWTRITDSAQLSTFNGHILMVLADSSGKEFYWTQNFQHDAATSLASNFGVYTPHFHASALSDFSEPFDTSLAVNYTATLPSSMMTIYNGELYGSNTSNRIGVWFWTEVEVSHHTYHRSESTYHGSDHYYNYATFTYSVNPTDPYTYGEWMGRAGGNPHSNNWWGDWNGENGGYTDAHHDDDGVRYIYSGSMKSGPTVTFNNLYNTYFKNYSAAQLNALIKYYETGACNNTANMSDKKGCIARLRSASVNTDVDTDNYDWRWLRNATDEEMTALATSFKKYLAACSTAGCSYKDYGTATIWWDGSIHATFDGENIFPQQNEGVADFKRSLHCKKWNQKAIREATIKYYSAATFKLFGWEAVQMPCYSGEVTLASNQVIVWDNNEIVDADSTVTVPASSTLIISSDVELNGSLNVEGKLIINAGGTLRCLGTDSVVKLKDGTRASFTIMDGAAACFYYGAQYIIIGDSCTMTVKGNCYFAGRIGLTGSLIIGNAGHLVLGACMTTTLTSNWLLSSHSRAEVAGKVFMTKNWNIGTILTMDKGAYLDNSQGGTISYFRQTTSQDQFRGQAFFSTTAPRRQLDE